MRRRALTGGVTAQGICRIRFDFKFNGVRHRPSLVRIPSDTNLRLAREHLAGIKQRIATGTLSFAEEFPSFRDLKKLPDGGAPRTCAQVFDEFLAHCEARVAKNDMATVTLGSYRRVLNGFWRAQVGTLRFLDTRPAWPAAIRTQPRTETIGSSFSPRARSQ